MRRRAALLAAAAWGMAAVAQNAPFRIGFLTHNDRAMGQLPIDLFVAQMRSRGWEPGRDFVIEPRYGDRDTALMAARARELAALNLPVIVAAATPSAIALAQATRTTPVVGFGLTGPVDMGLAQSLARPGGNVTGSTFSQPQFAAKILEVLKSAVPRIVRVTVIHNPSYPVMAEYTRHGVRAAAELGIALHFVEVTKTENFRMEDVERSNPDALFVAADYAVNPIQAALASFAIGRKLPSIGTNRTYPMAGGLMSLDADVDEMFGVAADYVIRILTRGASASTLPIQEQTRYHLVFNRKTADAIQFTMSQQLMLRVKEVIT
ncbi:MAG: ABC transporter substrate-binding protein [Burkholderiales bacterium]|nr:ABC transporter substrate-binding protein [Burkholderiales bacterium]